MVKKYEPVTKRLAPCFAQISIVLSFIPPSTSILKFKLKDDFKSFNNLIFETHDQ